MEAAMDLLRRMPPSLSQQALDSLLALLPTHSSELLSQSDQPLQVAWDEEHDKHYLLCDYNRDGDSYRSFVSRLFLLFGACGVINLLMVLRLVYQQRLLRFTFVRSPWSSKYKPELEDGVQPSAKLRTLEQEANEVFSIYRDQYYEGGISSVYVWELEDGKGFAACVLIKKDGSDSGDGRRGLLQEGSWDAIHVIEVKEDQDRQYGHYCLTSTVMLALTTADQTSGPFSLSGSITRQMESNLPSEPGHLCNMGRLIEEMESKLRNGLDQVYFGKTKEVVFTLREPMGVMSSASQSLQRRIASDVSRSRS